MYEKLQTQNSINELFLLISCFHFQINMQAPFVLFLFFNFYFSSFLCFVFIITVCFFYFSCICFVCAARLVKHQLFFILAFSKQLTVLVPNLLATNQDAWFDQNNCKGEHFYFHSLSFAPQKLFKINNKLHSCECNNECEHFDSGNIFLLFIYLHLINSLHLRTYDQNIIVENKLINFIIIIIIIIFVYRVYLYIV